MHLVEGRLHLRGVELLGGQGPPSPQTRWRALADCRRRLGDRRARLREKPRRRAGRRRRSRPPRHRNWRRARHQPRHPRATLAVGLYGPLHALPRLLLGLLLDLLL
eukprot:364267-Pyramimonas_sp.AAC.1